MSTEDLLGRVAFGGGVWLLLAALMGWAMSRWFRSQRDASE